MKIIFCGPPHSGKSVFITNLISKLPTDSHTIIRACPDGEGNWSNNKNQYETGIVRKKGDYTYSFINDACMAIDNQTNKIVLVDIGGRLSDDKIPIFKHCDSFVVLSKDQELKNKWLEFGKKQGLECIGCFDSSLDGNDEIYSNGPYLEGKITGLERGANLGNSIILNSLLDNIIQKSGYGKNENSKIENTENSYIDDTNLGFELGCGKNVSLDDGTVLKKVFWTASAVPEVYKYISEKSKGKNEIRFYGIRANFILSALCKAAKKNGINDIKTYDIRTMQYIDINDIPIRSNIEGSEGLSYNLIENQDNIFMDIDIPKEKYTLEDYKKCILPQIDENKNLFISGRLPLWLACSITNTYESNRIFTFQPGNGFTCISSLNEKELGKVVNGIDGIDINRYFEDKKSLSKVKNQLPSNIIKNNWISKLKQLFNFEQNQNLKYLDNEIRNDLGGYLKNNFELKNKLKKGISYVFRGLEGKKIGIKTKNIEKDI